MSTARYGRFGSRRTPGLEGARVLLRRPRQLPPRSLRHRRLFDLELQSAFQRRGGLRESTELQVRLFSRFDACDRRLTDPKDLRERRLGQAARFAELNDRLHDADFGEDLLHATPQLGVVRELGVRDSWPPTLNVESPVSHVPKAEARAASGLDRRVQAAAPHLTPTCQMAR